MGTKQYTGISEKSPSRWNYRQCVAVLREALGTAVPTCTFDTVHEAALALGKYAPASPRRPLSLQVYLHVEPPLMLKKLPVSLLAVTSRGMTCI